MDTLPNTLLCDVIKALLELHKLAVTLGFNWADVLETEAQMYCNTVQGI